VIEAGTKNQDVNGFNSGDSDGIVGYSCDGVCQRQYERQKHRVRPHV
jgi:hypothetical protein